MRGRLGGDRNRSDSSYAVEVAGSIDLGNGFNLFAGAAFEDADSGDNELIQRLCDLRNWRMVVRC